MFVHDNLDDRSLARSLGISMRQDPQCFGSEDHRFLHEAGACVAAPLGPTISSYCDRRPTLIRARHVAGTCEGQ